MILRSLSVSLLSAAVLLFGTFGASAQPVPVCDFSQYPQSFACALPTSTPVPTATPTNTPLPTATATPQPTATPLPNRPVVTLSHNHLDYYPMPAGWAESLDALVTSDVSQRVTVTFRVIDSTGVVRSVNSQLVSLVAGVIQRVAAGWPVPITEPAGEFTVAATVTDSAGNTLADAPLYTFATRAAKVTVTPTPTPVPTITPTPLPVLVQVRVAVSYLQNSATAGQQAAGANPGEATCSSDFALGDRVTFVDGKSWRCAAISEPVDGPNALFGGGNPCNCPADADLTVTGPWVAITSAWPVPLLTYGPTETVQVCRVGAGC